jgi:Zn ribbon nucleic-acid-binding protein
MPASCKHPQVRVVAREDDVEFVECQKCGEVFDSAEFADILAEEEPPGEAQGDEA